MPGPCAAPRRTWSVWPGRCWPAFRVRVCPWSPPWRWRPRTVRTPRPTGTAHEAHGNRTALQAPYPAIPGALGLLHRCGLGAHPGAGGGQGPVDLALPRGVRAVGGPRPAGGRRSAACGGGAARPHLGTPRGFGGDPPQPGQCGGVPGRYGDAGGPRPRRCGGLGRRLADLLGGAEAVLARSRRREARRG